MAHALNVLISKYRAGRGWRTMKRKDARRAAIGKIALENMKRDDKALEKMSTLIKLSQLSGYIQITPGQESMWGQEMAEVFGPLVSDKFKVCKIKEKQDIWPQFAKLFGGKYEL